MDLTPMNKERDISVNQANVDDNFLISNDDNVSAVKIEDDIDKIDVNIDLQTDNMKAEPLTEIPILNEVKVKDLDEKMQIDSDDNTIKNIQGDI